MKEIMQELDILSKSRVAELLKRGVPIRKIKEMNNLKNDNLRIGQKLDLPK